MGRLARIVYRWPARLGYWWRVLVGPVPRRYSDGSYILVPHAPLLWRRHGWVTLSESRLIDEEAGILMANRGGTTPAVMPPATRAAFGRQWNAIVAEQHRKGAQEFAAYLAEYEREEG